MPTSVEEYRRARYRDVTLPSTLPSGEHPVFKIRKPPVEVLLEVMRELEIQISPEENPEAFEKTVEERLKDTDMTSLLQVLIKKLLPACVVEPRVTLDPNEKDALWIGDIDYEDQIALFEAIWDFAGLGKKAEEARNLSSAPQ